MARGKPRRKRRRFGRLRLLPSGRWQAGYIGPDLRLHNHKGTFASDIAAEGWLATERRKIDLGTWGAVERSDAVTLRTYATQWLSQRELRPRTRALYESMLNRLILPELGDTALVALTPAMIRTWHAGLGTDHPTRNAHSYAILHAICATAVMDEVLDANPCRIKAAMQTRRRHDVEVLSPAQVDQLAAKMPAALRASVVLAAWCGLRWGETSELRRKDVSDDYSVLRVRRAVTYLRGRFYVGPPKTAAGIRDIAIPPHIQPMLKSHLSKHVGKPADSLLFPDPNGGHLHSEKYRPQFKRAATAIGKPGFRVHDCRHVGAVLAAQAGATIAELQHRLGHTTAEMALRYQSVAEGRDAEIARRLSKLAEQHDTPDS